MVIKVPQHVSEYGDPSPGDSKPFYKRVMASPGHVSEAKAIPETSFFPTGGQDSVPLPNHIEEYLKESVGENAFRDLFEATDENVDLRSELDEKELDCVNKIYINNLFLKEKIGSDIYKQFLIKYMRLKVSFNRGSRGEFVDINRKDHFETNMNRFNTFSNLSKVKE